MRLIDADALDYGFPMTDDVYGLSRQIGIEMVKARIAEAPTIEAEPVRHGRWEVNELGYLVCTNCAWVRYGIPLVEHFTYCPNCGAKMDGDSHDQA